MQRGYRSKQIFNAAFLLPKAFDPPTSTWFWLPTHAQLGDQIWDTMQMSFRKFLPAPQLRSPIAFALQRTSN
jgi:hypothetical protein